MENIMSHKSPDQTPPDRRDVGEKTKTAKVILPKSIWQECRAIINEDETDWNQFAKSAFLNYIKTRNSKPESRAA